MSKNAKFQCQYIRVEPTRPSRCASAATCAVEVATNSLDRGELRLLEKAKKKYKKIRLTAPMSAARVKLDISSCISTVPVCLTKRARAATAA